MGSTAPRPEPHRPPGTQRATFAGIEWLRVLACLGIVAFHQHTPGERFGYAGLPVFAMLTAAMAARSARGRDWSTFRAGRLRRLLLPWLVWSALYAIVQCALAALAHQPLWTRFDWTMLLLGTYPHLWYLPFAAITALLVGRFGNCGRVWHWLAAGAGAIPACGWLMTNALPMPVLNWACVLPGALLGVGLARQPLGCGMRTLPLGFVLAGAIGCSLAWLTGLDAMLLQYAIAVLATAFAWSLSVPTDRWTARVAATTLGVYVLHPFVGLLLVLLAVSASVPFTDWTLFAAIAVGSFVLTLLLRATPLRAVL